MSATGACPDTGRMAAFIEGRLSGARKDALIAHVLACEECSIVLSEAARYVNLPAIASRRGGWGARAAAAGIAAAAVLAAGGWLGIAWWQKHDLGSRPEALLVRAVGTRRPAEGRLSGDFAYGSPDSIRRSEGKSHLSDEEKLELAAAAAAVAKNAADTPNAENLRTLGAAHLAMGDFDEAVTALERSRQIAPKDPQTLSDLGAALMERGTRRNHPEDYPAALSRATEAVGLAPSDPAAQFNRALALEKLHLREKAIHAWEDYLKLDARSPWADEARKHLAELREPTAMERWPADRERLEQAAAAGDEAKVTEIVDAHRQAAREWLRDVLLADWGSAVLQRDQAAAAHTLGVAEVVARVYSRLTGDPMSADMVDVVRAASAESPAGARVQALASAHLALGQSMRDLEALRMDHIVPMVETARAGFEWWRSPAVMWADYQLCRADYYAGNYARAMARLERVRRTAQPLHYFGLVGQTDWSQGVIQGVQSHLSTALTRYYQALSEFQRIGDADYSAFMMHLLAEDLRYLGDHGEEWRRRQAALVGTSEIESARRFEVILMGAAISSLEDGYPLAAFEFQQQGLSSALKRLDEVQSANAFVWCSLIHCHLGDLVTAASDLKEARRWTDRIPDTKLRERLDSEIGYAEGMAAAAGDPSDACEGLTRAIAFFKKRNDDARLAELYLARGRAEVRKNDPDSAAADFQAGIETFEKQRFSVILVPQRISFFDTASELFDEAISFNLSRGHSEEALTIAERGRGRQLLDDIKGTRGPRNAQQIRAAIPPRTSLVYYASLPDLLVTWVVSASRIDVVSTPIGAEGLERMVSAFVETVQKRKKEEKFQEAASALYDALIRSIESSLDGANTLVFVPDKALHALPFAALMNRQTHRYLIESHIISVVPSATLFVNSIARARELGPLVEPSVLAVGDPAFDRSTYPYLPRLPSASEEARQVAALYSRSKLLAEASATKSAFLSAAADHSYIHFAGHAVSHDGDPLGSRLILAPDEAQHDDGTLTADQIYGRRFDHARLVVLAACATASGRISRGEGPLSLARPFLADGVPDVIASLWDIDDRASLGLSVQIHTRLAAGDSPMVALRSAQLELLHGEDATMRSPGAWAAFELIGGS